ncbi:MAG: hypothetical protein ACXWHG_10905 [Thermoanaerobaculia bacterium]
MRHPFTKAVFLLLLLVDCGGGSPPRELSPGIVKSSGGVTLAASRTVNGTNIITDLELTQQGQVIAIGNQGVVVLSPSLTPVSSGRFEGSSLFLADSIIRPETEKSIVAISTFDGNPQIATFRLDGRRLWSYKEKNPLVSGTHGLMPEVGRSGAVVVSHQQRGLLLLDSETGRVLNAFAAPFAPEVRTGDFDGDGSTEIAQMNDSGLEMRSNIGQVTARRNVVASWAVAKGLGRPDALALWDGTNFEVLGSNLATQQTIRGTFTGSKIPALHLEAAAASRSSDEHLFAFLLGGRGGWHRTTLLIYDGAGQLLHHEILPDDFMSLRFIAPGSLLVGGRNVLRSYLIRHGTAPEP